MEQTFPNKHQSLWVCSSGALLMPDLDGCAKTVVILAYATKTIQC